MEKIAHAVINPLSSLNLLSQAEITAFTTARGELYDLYRRCALAILNTDSSKDDAAQIYADYSDFDVRLIPQPRGLRLELFNAPGQAFVDGRMIRGIQEHLFAALRDIVYTDMKMASGVAIDSADATNKVFRILRNATIVRPDLPPRMVVCWGGHAISREEYDYAKQVGYALGLRGMDIVTGCGIGAMKGPMKGAAVGHAKQQIKQGRYIGISEPGIIASESPNAIVNELVIMPDIEKRLEAFVRLAHAIVVFPGGVGTVEEVLYLFSILLHPDNAHSLPVVFAGPEDCADYFAQLEDFLVACLGEDVRRFYQVILGAPEEVGRAVRKAVKDQHVRRRRSQQAYYFNWELEITADLQEPFLPTHANMAALDLRPELPRHELAGQLRRAFSGLVAGNVKAFGIEQVRLHGPYQLHGEPRLLANIDRLLRLLVKQQRMKLGEGARDYRPCYQIAG
ncbi:nucleotide 5'-monophosphate nucleosidase PpnN [Kineobactrum salinum]|uniref:AMP nucleosidase n=1 Tax=Kineobactrum salinum TaxID=2708301 RepID=A0A6C0U2Z3_9GAMM|nr:nucleotide 5'-monophosphate nucleosidase PpnN [Kineobactrum salinum]QIB65337.1 LOG family protein [Kineobactrum salinum]